MNHRSIISTSVIQALQELRVNKLRTFLSLLGITIGIFCIIAVLTVVDSMKNNIKEEMASLGSDVLYINRWPWMDEGGEYKWWEFWRRPSMSPKELRAIQQQVPAAGLTTLCLTINGLEVKYHDEEATGIMAYAVTPNFEKLQNIDVAQGRYLSLAELDGGQQVAVIGNEIYKTLFRGGIDPIGKHIAFKGRRFAVVGVLKDVGQNMAGFDFDAGIVIPYYAAATFTDPLSLNNDPLLIVKAREGRSMLELKTEVEGALRGARKVKPGDPNNFAINQLSQITERLDLMFGTINVIGWIIAGFSLLVGGFGIANIMFVTVKERTKVIGLKKAVGARPASILMEFLVEAVTLCVTGGLIGIVIVFLLSLLLTYGLDFTITLSLKNFIIGVGISGLVGVLAGFIPARAASRLDPVVAIRSH